MRLDAISLLVFVSALLSSGELRSQLLLGGDISALTVFEHFGAEYTDQGTPGDAISILEGHGANSFRIRLFVDPLGADPIAVQDISYALALASRAKANGSSLLLDLHYSDTWADPGHQSKPAAWDALSFEQLQQQVYDYTKDVIEQLDDAGLAPEMVQIGNEIGNGLLWDDGRLWRPGVPEHVEFDNLAALLTAGIQGARDGSGGSDPDILIHHANGGNWGATSYYFDRLLPRLDANGAGIDAIGYSYYPKFHYNGPGDGDIADLRQNLNNTAAVYGKPVHLVETGFAYTGDEFEPDYEFPVSPSGQADFLQAVVDAVESVPNGQGQGVYWWYPEATPTRGIAVWEGGRYGLFDQDGEALPALEVFANANSTPDPPAPFTSSFLTNANSTPGSPTNAGVYGQGFSPSVDASPDPQLADTDDVLLESFTFFKDENEDQAQDIRLAIFDDFGIDLSSLSTQHPGFLGISESLLASTSGLQVGESYSFTFSEVLLAYGSDYLALFVNDDGAGNLTPIQVSALTASYSETAPGSGVWTPVSNYGAEDQAQYAVSNWTTSSGSQTVLAPFFFGGDAKFSAAFLPSQTSTPGDFNGDGVVDAADYTVWRDNEGMPAGSLSNDTDGGIIGAAQYNTWVANYGQTYSRPSFAIPEPTALALSGLAALSRRLPQMRTHKMGNVKQKYNGVSRCLY